MTAKLELYRVFREVAETGNISAAAQNLYISQSAVSQSVKQLEGALQTRLFIRSPRGVTLTDDGQMLFEHVRSAMGLLETGEEKLAQTRALQMGKLVIGASDTVTSQFLLPHLDSFHKKYPNIHIQIISGRSHKVLGLLRSGKVDVAFASSPSEDEGLSCVPCFATHSCFVAAADYPCDFERAYSMQELAALPLILLERKASSRVYLEKYFLAHGVSLSPEIELGARSLLVDLARIGFGVAGVTREFVTAELESGAIRQLKTDFEIPPRSVDMCTLRDVPPRAARSDSMRPQARPTSCSSDACSASSVPALCASEQKGRASPACAPQLFSAASTESAICMHSVRASSMSLRCRTRSSASRDSPYPSPKRRGMKGWTSPPRRRSASVSRQVEVIPSTSKSPKTAMVSPSAMAR